MPKKNSKGKTALLVIIAALVAGGAVAGGFAIKNYLDEHAIAMPWNAEKYADTYVGVRLFNDGETEPVRLGAAANFKAGINGERNDFDAYPVYSSMKQSKDKNGNVVVNIPDHYVKTVVTADYTDWIMSPSKLDDTFIKVASHSVGAYQGNVTKDAKGKGTLHSQKDVYADFNFTKNEAVNYAKNAEGYLVTYAEAMDVSFLQTIEFATADMQEIFSGFTSSDNRIEDTLTFNPDIQKTGKTNVIRVESEYLDDALSNEGKKIAEVLIPGFTSICIQEMDGYISSDIATVTGYKKANIEVEAAASSSSSASSASSASSVEKEVVNVYEITIDKTINFEEEQQTLAERWAARQTADGNDAEAEDFDTDCYIQIGTYVRNGMTDGLKGTSHELTEINGVKLPVGTRPFSYRGVENWYGNVYEWLDGVQIKTVNSTDATKAGAFLQTCMDKTLMGESDAEDAKTPDYKTISKLDSGNYAAMGEIAEDKLFPLGVQSAEDGSLHDYFYYSNGSTLQSGDDQVTLRPVFRGSFWSDASGGGSFYLYGGDFSNWDFYIGARLGF